MAETFIPTQLQIEDAFHNLSNVCDKDLEGYEWYENDNPETNIIFPFMKYSGGCCVTVPLKKEGAPSKCLRVWYKDMPMIEERSSIVCEALRKHKLEYFLDYKYLKSAISINGKECHGIRMDWVNYPTLAHFLYGEDPNKSMYIPSSKDVRTIKENFFKMCQKLNEAEIAHGDLSPSNILVKDNLDILLIDYDSLYVPQMGQNHFKQNIEGTDGFQHRLRDSNVYAEKNNDYFSQQVIYVCLLAFEKNPELCKKITEKSLLFKKSDFISNNSFLNSEGYRCIHDIGDEELNTYLEQLRIAVSSPLNEVRSIIEITTDDVSNIESAKPEFYLANFCGTCGHHFDNQTDLYCPDCGKKREIFRS